MKAATRSIRERARDLVTTRPFVSCRSCGPVPGAQGSGAGPYTWTINAVTTGLTASGGTAYEYPQATDALTWAGDFDVPARFDTDEMRYQMLESGPGRRMYQLASVPVVGAIIFSRVA